MFNVAYEKDGGLSLYLLDNVPTIGEALKHATAFGQLYFNADGTPKPYPNGKGVYKFGLPVVVRVEGRSLTWIDPRSLH